MFDRQVNKQVTGQGFDTQTARPKFLKTGTWMLYFNQILGIQRLGDARQANRQANEKAIKHASVK